MEALDIGKPTSSPSAQTTTGQLAVGAFTCLPSGRLVSSLWSSLRCKPADQLIAGVRRLEKHFRQIRCRQESGRIAQRAIGVDGAFAGDHYTSMPAAQ
jgi:hypothetical protein